MNCYYLIFDILFDRICLVTIAPTHKLLHDGEIIKVNFQTNRGKDRMDNKVRGKGKKGAQQLEVNSLLCEVECSNGNRYLLRRLVLFIYIINTKKLNKK